MALDSSQNNQKSFTKSLMGSGQGMMTGILEDPFLASRLQQQLSNENLLGPCESTRSMALQLGTAGGCKPFAVVSRHRWPWTFGSN